LESVREQASVADLTVQLLDLTVPAHLGELPHPRIKGAHSPLKQLLLPRADLT
jgi:hypothetical protein